VIEAGVETAASMPINVACEPVTASAPDHAAPPPAPVKRVPYEACPLCNSGNFPVFLTTDCSAHPLYNPALPPAINWCRCTSCGHVFTDGYFSQEDRMAVFGEPVPYQTVGHDAETQRFMSSRIVSQIAKLKPGGDWLDLGVGNGSLLFTAEEWGYRPVGIDRHSQNVEMLQALGYEAHRGSIEELDMSGRFSVISMSDILARMPDPRAVLGEAKRLLKPGGILFCATPNMASIVWRIMDSTGENTYWDEIEHYHNFTRERLYALLDATGFRPVFYNVNERYRACMDVIAMND
jgi:SAM-dependent methyltransferase